MKDSSCSCLGALQPLLTSIRTSSIEVHCLTPWTRKQALAEKLSQEEGRGEDAGGAQLGTERVSSLAGSILWWECTGLQREYISQLQLPSQIPRAMGLKQQECIK